MAALRIARAHAHVGEQDFKVDIRAGEHALTADESPRLGGRDEGPSPYELLLASLSACTAITLRMYARRKGWPLTGVALDLRYSVEDQRAWIDRELTLEGTLDAEQRARLADIAERTPVTLTLKSGVEIRTELREAAAS